MTGVTYPNRGKFPSRNQGLKDIKKCIWTYLNCIQLQFSGSNVNHRYTNISPQNLTTWFRRTVETIQYSKDFGHFWIWLWSPFGLKRIKFEQRCPVSWFWSSPKRIHPNISKYVRLKHIWLPDISTYPVDHSPSILGVGWRHSHPMSRALQVKYLTRTSTKTAGSSWKMFFDVFLKTTSRAGGANIFPAFPEARKASHFLWGTISAASLNGFARAASMTGTEKRHQLLPSTIWGNVPSSLTKVTFHRIWFMYASYWKHGSPCLVLSWFANHKQRGRGKSNKSKAKHIRAASDKRTWTSQHQHIVYVYYSTCDVPWTLETQRFEDQGREERGGKRNTYQS